MNFFKNSLSAKNYLKILNEYNTKFNNKFVIQNTGSFIGDKSFYKLLTCYEILKKIKNVKGDIIEFGVWNGNNLISMKKIIDLLNINKKIYGYDHFDGMPSNQKDYKRNSFKGEIYLEKYFIKFFRLRNIFLIKDDIDNLENHKKKFKKISLIYIDCDLYKTTKNILNSLAPKVSKGGLIVFDEGNQGKSSGESKALSEFYKENKKRYKKFLLKKNYQPDVFLEKIK